MKCRRVVMHTGAPAVAAAAGALAAVGAAPAAFDAAGTSLHGTVTATGSQFGGDWCRETC